MLHLDMDAFFASVEQVLDPQLKGKPVIVGGHADDRSVVASASYEARRSGVRVAMPLAAARRLCPHGIFLRGSFRHYAEASERIHDILLEFSPAVEAASVDDFYVDLAGLQRLHGPPLGTADRIRRRISRETGLSASIGLGPNKLIARIASARAKPRGMVMVLPGHQRAFLRPMRVSELPGVGPQTQEVLGKFNIHTVGDLAAVEEALLTATFGEPGRALWRCARGEGDIRVGEPTLPRSISRETTFEQDTDDRRMIRAMLYYLTERAARQLRSLHMHARRVGVKLRYADMKTVVALRALPRPTDQDVEFYSTASALMDRLFTRRLRVRLVGVCLSDLRSGLLRQRDFLQDRRFDKLRRLYAGLDHIRERFGFSAVTAGPALDLLNTTPRDEHGFLLRTPSCSR